MSHDDRDFAGLLQALEHSLELSDRLTTVVRQFIDASHEGRTLDPATVREYEAQLQTVDAQRARVQTAITHWWALVGRDTAQ